MIRGFTPEQLASTLQALIEHVRQDVKEVSDPRAQALFEAAAEVLTGLRKAFTDFGQRTEEAWKA